MSSQLSVLLAEVSTASIQAARICLLKQYPRNAGRSPERETVYLGTGNLCNTQSILLTCSAPAGGVNSLWCEFGATNHILPSHRLGCRSAMPSGISAVLAHTKLTPCPLLRRLTTLFLGPLHPHHLRRTHVTGPSRSKTQNC